MFENWYIKVSCTGSTGDKHLSPTSSLSVLQPSEPPGFDPSLILLPVLSHIERGGKPRHNDRRPDGGAPRGGTTHAGKT